jgi:hypothetical protein
LLLLLFAVQSAGFADQLELELVDVDQVMALTQTLALARTRIWKPS